MPEKSLHEELEGNNHKGKEQVAAFFLWGVFN